MIGPPPGARIWIAAGVTDLRRGFTGLSAAVQTLLEQDPFAGHVFVFCGRRGDLIKLLWWDGDGLLFVCKAVGRRKIRVAESRKRNRIANPRPAIHALVAPLPDLETLDAAALKDMVIR